MPPKPIFGYLYTFHIDLKILCRKIVEIVILNALSLSASASRTNKKSGKIAEELEHVNHHVRTRLDEIKRTELERLRLAAMRQVISSFKIFIQLPRVLGIHF